MTTKKGHKLRRNKFVCNWASAILSATFILSRYGAFEAVSGSFEAVSGALEAISNYAGDWFNSQYCTYGTYMCYTGYTINSQSSMVGSLQQNGLWRILFYFCSL